MMNEEDLKKVGFYKLDGDVDFNDIGGATSELILNWETKTIQYHYTEDIFSDEKILTEDGFVSIRFRKEVENTVRKIVDFLYHEKGKRELKK